MKNTLYALTFVTALSGCSVTLPVGDNQYGCTAAHGGDPYKCWQALRLDQPRPAKGSSYHSAGTMSLAHATCVRQNSQWWFHGAHHPTTREISNEGNAVLRRAYGIRYPAVVDYLDNRGALNTTKWTKMSGLDLNRLGVPLCDRRDD